MFSTATFQRRPACRGTLFLHSGETPAQAAPTPLEGA
jgi:hypothetical protein